MTTSELPYGTDVDFVFEHVPLGHFPSSSLRFVHAPTTQVNMQFMFKLKFIVVVGVVVVVVVYLVSKANARTRARPTTIKQRNVPKRKISARFTCCRVMATNFFQASKVVRAARWK